MDQGSKRTNPCHAAKDCQTAGADYTGNAVVNTQDLFETPAPPSYPALGDSQVQSEKYLTWRLGLTNPALAAFSVRGGMKELLRAEVLNHPGRVMGKSPLGKLETLGSLFERIYGEPAHVKKSRREKL